jgi:hypothetical protein
LSQGTDIIVALNAGGYSYPDLTLDLDDYPGIPGQNPGSAVQVIGVDRRDPGHPMVVLNDPASAAGGGQPMPLQDFLDAWGDYDNFAVFAGGQRDG